MENDLLKYKIAVGLFKGLGSKLVRTLVAYLGDVRAVFEEKPENIEKIPGFDTRANFLANKKEVLERAEKEIEFILKNNIKVSFFTDDDFPFRLNNCADAPTLLYYKGNHSLSSNKMISIVGTRKVTELGKENCRNLIRDLSVKVPNCVIVSGLAYGVDICAHKAALEFGLPTFGVLAHGLDDMYPRLHRHIANDMLNNGLIITEYMQKTIPDKPNFVRRNRIVAGLTDATVVVESAAKGGGLITANIAQSYGRDVMAFPGRTDDKYSKGCNKLIKTNVAALIENADDLIYTLNWSTVDSPKQLSMFFEPEGDEGVIYRILRLEKELSVNFIAMKAEMPIAKVSAILLKLEFDGLVKCLPGNIYRCN